MKFKYKVTAVNIIILSIALGITGFLMIRMNFELALNTLIDTAISENNMLQTYTEYELLNFVNSNEFDIKNELVTVGQKLTESLLPSGSDVNIVFNDSIVFESRNSNLKIPKDLLNTGEKISKNFMLVEQDDVHYIYVVSTNTIDRKYLHIVTRQSVENAYILMSRQISSFRIILIFILSIGSLVIFLLATILTKPLEKLNSVSHEMTNGNYAMRAFVNSKDEIGELALNFNEMAESVDNHITQLRDQIHRREQFVADFSHEIKTPLTSIIGYADTLRSIDLPKEDQLEALNYIVNSSKRLENMSGKLFELIYLGSNNIEMLPINTCQLAKEIASYVKPLLENASIKLSIDVEEATIPGSKDLLVTAFSNLIDNSRKASKEGSSILLLGSFTSDTEYTLSVKDFGYGISRNHLDKICHEFYMVDKSRSRLEGSAGLGLSLSALIFERHNGVLEIISEENVGTEVKVKFNEIKKD